MKSAALVALLATVPSSTLTASTLSVVRSDVWTQHVYVRTGTMLDIALPAGESTTSNPFTGDGRWQLTTFADGVAVHVAVKPGVDASEQQLIIPTSYKTLHLWISAGPQASAVSTVIFSEPPAARVTQRQPSRALTYNPAPSVTPAALRPRPAATPRTLAVKSCDSLDHNYRWKGDDRVDFERVCNDGQHTFALVRAGHNPPGVVPFKVDAGGRQDQITNASLVTGFAGFPDQWIIDGTPDRIAFVADSSTGQVRKTVCRPPDRGCDGK